VLIASIAVFAVGVGVSGQAPSGAPAPQPTDRYVTVNGLRLHYLDWGGTGQPLILVHGLDRHAHTFDHIAPHFTSRYRVIAVDMRGHGESAWDPDARYMVEDYVRDMEGFVDQLQLREIVIWGNSTGGRVAQVYAGLHPERVSRVISEDVGPERPRQIADNYERRVKAEQAGWAAEAEVIAQVRKTNPGMPDANVTTYVRYGTTKRADGRIIWKRDPNVVRGFVVTDLWQVVSKISMPALYIVGGRSTIVPVDTQEKLRATLPRVRIVTVADAGHYPSEDKPSEVLALIDSFLASR
jgi:pimeloyl-ACP methyl ester carboxylesterase